VKVAAVDVVAAAAFDVDVAADTAAVDDAAHLDTV
jgi:hypothetical protein